MAKDGHRITTTSVQNHLELNGNSHHSTGAKVQFIFEQTKNNCKYEQENVESVQGFGKREEGY